MVDDNPDDRNGGGRRQADGVAMASAVCADCGVHLFGVTRLGDVQVGAVLEHLWSAHPSVVRRPRTLALDTLLSRVRIEPA
jgi:hypothetical protein